MQFDWKGFHVASKSTSSGGSRTVEEAVPYALAHWIRIEILVILHEGPRSASELSRMIGVSLGKIGHHIKELTDSGRIELARVKKVRNADQHIYRAVELPLISDEEAEDLSFEERQEIAATVLQALVAESFAALRTGKLSEDPVSMGWSWFHLDEQGRKEAHEEQVAFWERMRDIEARSVNRVAESGEATTSTIVAALGFERFRPTGQDGAAYTQFRSSPQGNAD
ncbi:MAG TPA: winged helix-turn-helix domain-containing protein [Solirubrobacterales bacterium]